MTEYVDVRRDQMILSSKPKFKKVHELPNAHQHNYLKTKPEPLIMFEDGTCTAILNYDYISVSLQNEYE